MGVQITELLKKHEINLENLSNKIIVIDASNHLYQFLTTIRSPDGTAFTDSKGNITSHLIGLFSRTTNLMQRNIKLAYVFDGQVPKLKHKELQQRKEVKREAEEKYAKAMKEQNIEDMKKYAGRFSRLTLEMTDEAKKLLKALGIPYVEAPSEGEAQAANIVRNNDAYAVSSQDADSLLFGASRLVRNLSITGRRKKAGKQAYTEINPEIIILEENLSQLNIDREQLIALGMLVGTDYNVGGIKGIGPVKALNLVKKHGKNFGQMFAEAGWSFDEKWQDVFELFIKIPVTDNYELKWKNPDKESAMKLLCTEHDFSTERVEKTIDSLMKSQKGLNEFF